MAARRVCYLGALALSGVFYIAYGQWLSWLVLLTVVLLPWFSLVLSLPALLGFRALPDGPGALEMGEEGRLWLLGSCSAPMPPFRGRLRLRRCSTGESWLYQDSDDLPTNHCGGLTVRAEGLKVYDYLGLFAFPLRCREKKTVLIRPRPVPMAAEPALQRLIRGWRPKFGGGFAENHELRLYRPGDSLNQIHWKLTAKTGSLILREPMEPQPGKILLTLELRGTPGELDRKLGRLVWLGEKLLDQRLPFDLWVLTGDGVLSFTLTRKKALKKAVDDLLCRPLAPPEARLWEATAAWHCHIGGDGDEA